MGLKGNLSTVNLADVFQVLSRGNSTGLLRIQAPEGPRFVEIQNGAISIAGRSAGRILLGDLLQSRGLLDEDKLEAALQVQRESGKMLGQVLIDQQTVTMQDLEEALRFQIEEEVCELFTLGKGEFDFLAGASLDAKIAPGGGLVKMKIDPNSLLLEAARRADEWKAIEARVPSQAFVFRLTGQGGEVLKSGTGLSPEGMVLLRLVQDSRSVEAMVQKACMGRLNTNQMLLELWDAGIVEPMPIESYEQAARSHLKLNRIDEAQRIAEFAAANGGAEMKTKVQAALAEIEKAKKAAISGTMTATGDPKIRSEVIRRNQPGLFGKKDRKTLPLIIAGVVILLLGGGGTAAYFKYFSGKKVDNTQRKLLDEQLELAQTEMNAQNYGKALEILRTFRSKDPDTQALASQKYDAEKKNVDVLLNTAISNFKTAFVKGPPEAVKTTADELDKFNGVLDLSEAMQQELSKARAQLNQVKNREKLEVMRTKLREADSSARTKPADVLKQAYEALLADSPPEEIATEIRDKLSRLSRARAEAESRLHLAGLEKDAGETEAAKTLFELVKRDGPGVDYSAKGAAGVDAIVKYLAECDKRLEKVDILQTQKLTNDARAELLKIIDSHPPERVLNQAQDTLRVLDSTPETELETEFKDAKDLATRQPLEARKKFLAILEKAPHSKTASGIVMKVKVTSEPANADLFFNGRAAGKTPTMIDVPAIGAAHFTFKKQGFQTEDLVEYNFRADSVSISMFKNPVLQRSLSAPAAGGLAANLDHIIVISSHAVDLCGLSDLKVITHVPLREKEDQKPEEVIGGGRGLLLGQNTIYVTLADKAIACVKLVGGDYSRLPLAATATSAPLAYTSKELPGKRLLGVASQAALELLFSDDGKVHKTVQAGKDSAEKPWGLALEGDLFYVPREDSLIAIVGHSGAKKWEAPIEGKTIGGPAVASGRSSVGLITESGQLIGLDMESGAKKFQRDLGGKPAPFLLSTPSAFLSVLQNGKVEFSAADKGGVLWSLDLKGEALLSPLIVRANEKEQEKAFVFCAQQKEFCEITVCGNGGVQFWKARMVSKPIALTTFADKIYVATADGELMVYDLN